MTALRLMAIAIALVALADPVWTRNLPVKQAVTIVTIHNAASASAERLRSLLSDDYDVIARVHPLNATEPACPRVGGCIVISDGMLPKTLSAEDGFIGAVLINQGADSRIVAVETPAIVHLNASSRIRVQIDGRTKADATRLQVFDGDILVGEGTSPEVAWIPLAAGPRRLRVVANSGEAEADVGVDVRDERMPVLMYEPESTWLGTFIRRVLDEDPRFNLRAHTRVAPRVSVSRDVRTQAAVGAASRPLTRDALAGIGAVVVTVPESLSAAETDLLDRFARVRGGSVILLPDRRPTGPALRLMPAIDGERIEAQPQAARSVRGGVEQASALRASEFLTFAPGPGVDVLESFNNKPVVVSRAIGRGRVITSGAMDAWRYRDNQFAEYWPALVADAIAAAGDEISVRPDNVLVTPDEDVRLAIEWRSITDIPDDIAAEGRYQCSDENGVVRLWPGPRRASFDGVFRPSQPGPCTVSVVMNNVVGRTAVLVASEVQRTAIDGRAFEAAVAAHGGLVVTTGDEDQLAARVRAQMPASREARDTRPMRSPMWLVPFAACLAGEWWLRRRRGLR